MNENQQIKRLVSCCNTIKLDFHTNALKYKTHVTFAYNNYSQKEIESNT